MPSGTEVTYSNDQDYLRLSLGTFASSARGTHSGQSFLPTLGPAHRTLHRGAPHTTTQSD